jgi:hypothetical protein
MAFLKLLVALFDVCHVYVCVCVCMVCVCMRGGWQCLACGSLLWQVPLRSIGLPEGAREPRCLHVPDRRI